MERRNKWGYVVRALHEFGCSRLAMTIARHKPRTKKAIVHKVMGGCLNVDPHKPDTLWDVISQPCVKHRWLEAEARFESSPTGFINSANLAWGERCCMGRLLLKIKPIRHLYLERSRKREDRYSVMALIRRKRLIKKAKKKRQPWHVKVSNLILRWVMLSVAAMASSVYLLGMNDLDTTFKTDLLAIIKAGLKAWYGTF